MQKVVGCEEGYKNLILAKKGLKNATVFNSEETVVEKDCITQQDKNYEFIQHQFRESRSWKSEVNSEAEREDRRILAELIC